MDFVYLVVIECQPRHFAQAPECSVFDDRDVVLTKVNVVKLAQLSERHGGHVLDLVV